MASSRTLRILCMASQQENKINVEKNTRNKQDKKDETEIIKKSHEKCDILDLENVPIVYFDDVDTNVDIISSLNFIEESDIFESVPQINNDDAEIEHSLLNNNVISFNSTSNDAYDEESLLENHDECDRFNLVNMALISDSIITEQKIMFDTKQNEKRKPLVPYELSSESEDENYESSDVDHNSSGSNSEFVGEKQEYQAEDIYNEIQTEGVRKRKRKPNKNEWMRNKNKRLRMKGKPYLGFSKKKGEKIKQNCPRRARSLKNTCTSKKCRNSKIRYCQEFTQECREGIFNMFWDMTWDQRKVFIASHVFKTPTFKKTTNNSRRIGTYTYHLNDGNENLQVCRNMFINTLDIGYKTVQHWIDNSSYGMAADSSARILTKEFIKTRYAESYKYLDEFFTSLPKLPSHYCRRDSTKLYLEYTFQNMNQLYEFYANEFCKDRNLTPLGRNVFSKTFKEKNLSLYTPKKDQCNVCFSFKYGNVTEEVYKAHIKRKEDAREAKINDKLKAEKDELIVITMDLQAVKLCPYLPANKIYFKTKLCCHNFTVYNLKSRDVMCYWFSENDNNLLKASTFTTCIINYLEDNCVTQLKIPVVMYSDGCGYQNRNNVLANALLNFAIKHQITIFQKFLEPGHTQMECDSVHSVIERQLKFREIHLPSDYVSVTKEARKTPAPYGTKLLDYLFFKDYSFSQHLRYSSIRPGRKPSDPVINDIKCIRYDPSGTIEVKLNYNEEYIQLPCRPKVMPPILNYPQLLSGLPKIKAEKWQHLQELKSVLPKDTYAFYDSILHD